MSNSAGPSSLSTALWPASRAETRFSAQRVSLPGSEHPRASAHLQEHHPSRERPPPHWLPWSCAPSTQGLSQSLSNQGSLPPRAGARARLLPAPLRAANLAHLHVDRACHHGCWGQLKLKKREEIYAKLLIAFVCNEIIQYSSDYRI